MDFSKDYRFWNVKTGEEVFFSYPIDAEEGVAEGWVTTEDPNTIDVDSEEVEDEELPPARPSKPPVVMEEEEATSTMVVNNASSTPLKSTTVRKPPRRRVRK